MPLPNWNGEKTGAIAATVLGSLIVLVFVAATLPFGLTKTGEVANEFDAFQEAQPAVALPDPVAWWKLDETSGTAATDSSGNGHTGTTTPGVTVGVPGQIGTAYDFPNTSGNYVSVPDSAAWDSPTFTIAAWVNLDTASDNFPRIMETNQGTATAGWLLFYRSLPQVGHDVNVFSCGVKRADAVLTEVDSTTHPTFGDWYHVACTYDGSQECIYVNGVEEACLANVGGVTSSLGNLYIGNRGPPSTPDRFWDGRIDDARYYDQAFSQGQVAELYNPGSTAVPAGSAHSSVSAFTLPVVLVLLTSMVFVGLSYFRSRGP